MESRLANTAGLSLAAAKRLIPDADCDSYTVYDESDELFEGGFTIDNVERLSDNTFKVSYFLLYDDNDYKEKVPASAELKGIRENNKTEWSIISFDVDWNNEIIEKNDNETADDAVSENSITGNYIVDYDATNAHNTDNVQSAFGSIISTSHGEMTINPDGTASWYIGYEGGAGNYIFDGSEGTITYKYMDESAGDSGTVSIRKITENGVEYIVMNGIFDESYNYDLYWIKQ